MSQENVQIAREAYAAFQAGDPDWASWIHPDIAWDFSAYPLADLPSKGHGRDALLSEVIETYFSGWLDYQGEIVETVDAGDDVVVVLHETARMRDSEVTLERDVAHVWTLREGKWVRWLILPSRDAALEAAGLQEQAMSEDENLAVVRRTIESFANDVETWLDTLDPAVEWHPDEEHRTLLRGRDAALRRRERWRETFQEGTYGLEIEELRGNGEHVFSDLREWGRGRGSGIDIQDHDYAHWKVRNGKIVYCCEYGTRAEALEAAGLSE